MIGKPRFRREYIMSLLLILSLGLMSCQRLQLCKLERELNRSSGLTRRQTARKIMSMGQPAEKQIVRLAKDPDLVIRRSATHQLGQVLGEDAIPLLQELLCDESPLVRLTAVEELMNFQPRSEKILSILRKAVEDSDNEVRKKAASAFWNFQRDYVTLRKRPEWDFAIEILQKQPLPLTGWRFHADPARSGHLERWFSPGLDDSAWDLIETGQCWNTALPDKVGKYEGVAWYRTTFTAPQKPADAFNEAVLHFAAVDESAWVWINGHFAGEHDQGTSGWNIPFDIEMGSFLKWGEANQLTVRVGNVTGAGGIYKPVELQILK
ncbi:MAG TPA: HEAT repeat domain-containing protein [Syntrophomonas sp.]|nr:HEAT repeat domain-containing protein [Syntrophomonas sp.]